MSKFSWSFSAYSSALTCLRKFKLCYIDKIVPESPLSSDLIFGSALHDALNGSVSGEDGKAIFELHWDSYKEQGNIQYGRYDWKALKTLGANFIRKFDQYHRDRYQLIFAEKRLYATYRGVSLEGTPDYYGLYDGRRSLRDFKTSSRNYEPEKAACATQLYLYAWLCKENGVYAEYPETLGYTVFNKGVGSIQDLTWEFNEQEMLKALDDMVDYCDNRLGEGSYPRNLSACMNYNRRCEFFTKCHGKDKEE